MALPTSRNTTYAAGSQVKSVDLNAIQDAIISVDALLTGLATSYAGITLAANKSVTISGTGKYKRGTLVRHVPAFLAQKYTSGTTAGSFQGSSGGSYQFGSINETVAFPIVLQEGERLLSVSARVACGTSSAATLRVMRGDFTAAIAASSQLGATATSVGTATLFETISVTGLAETAGSTFLTYYADVTMSAGTNAFVAGLLYSTDVP